MPPPPDVRVRLLEFYEHYNPAKISSLESIVAQYPDMEELFTTLETQYGPEPWKLKNPLRARLLSLLEKTGSVEPCRVDELLEAYRGRELDLFRSLEDVAPQETAHRDTILSLLLSIDPRRVDTAGELMRQWAGREAVLVNALRNELKALQTDTVKRKTQEAELHRGREILQGLRHDNGKMAKSVGHLEQQVLQVRVQRGIQRAILRDAHISNAKLITLSVHDDKKQIFVPAEEGIWAFLEHAAEGVFTRDIEVAAMESCAVRSSHAPMTLLFGTHVFALIMREWCAVSPHTVSVQGPDGLRYFPGEAWWRQWPTPVVPLPPVVARPTNALAPGKAGLGLGQASYFDANSVISAKLREVKYAEVTDVMRTEPGVAVGGKSYWSYFVDEWELLSQEMSEVCVKSEFFGSPPKAVRSRIPLDEL